MYKSKKEGGLGFWDIPAKVAALRTTWVVKYMLNKLSPGLLEAWNIGPSFGNRELVYMSPYGNHVWIKVGR